MIRASIVCFVLLVVGACSSESTTSTPPVSSSDGGSDATSSNDDSSTPPTDAGNESSPVDEDAGIGQTCIGYGAGETCETEAGKFGYVCFDGAPPGIAGCKLTRASGTLGNNYCCTENECVEQVDQGSACNGVAGKPHRFQCPPTDTGNATPPADCVEHNSGSTDVEKFYCCP